MTNEEQKQAYKDRIRGKIIAALAGLRQEMEGEEKTCMGGIWGHTPLETCLTECYNNPRAVNINILCNAIDGLLKRLEIR